MNSKDIFEIIDRFETSSLSRLYITDRDFSIEMERSQEDFAAGSPKSLAVNPEAKTDSKTAKIKEPEETKSEDNRILVKAPLVGTYYAAPDPASEAFVSVGQHVEKGQTLCIIESMKMLNELKSPVKGKIKSIYGRNGELAEFDQPLFEVEVC